MEVVLSGLLSLNASRAVSVVSTVRDYSCILLGLAGVPECSRNPETTAHVEGPIGWNGAFTEELRCYTKTRYIQKGNAQMRRTMVIRNGQNAMKPVEIREHGIETVVMEQAGGRRPYSNPRLIVHGTLQEITNNVGNGFLDFPQGSSIAG